MNASRLLEHFDRISEAPDAIPKLRRFILDLAVRGKLVTQDASESAASESRKGADTPEAAMPFALPANWRWLRFGAIHDLVRGVSYTKSDVADTEGPGFLPILRANNIGAGINFDDPVFVRAERVSPDQMLRRGDYLVALSSGSKNLVGKAALVSVTGDARSWVGSGRDAEPSRSRAPFGSGRI